MMVRMERLELSRLATLEPKSSVYTNFTTSAETWIFRKVIIKNWCGWRDSNSHVLRH
jgi:hypothetical protein